MGHGQGNPWTGIPVSLGNPGTPTLTLVTPARIWNMFHPARLLLVGMVTSPRQIEYVGKRATSWLSSTFLYRSPSFPAQSLRDRSSEKGSGPSTSGPSSATATPNTKRLRWRVRLTRCAGHPDADPGPAGERDRRTADRGCGARNALTGSSSTASATCVAYWPSTNGTTTSLIERTTRPRPVEGSGTFRRP